MADSKRLRAEDFTEKGRLFRPFAGLHSVGRIFLERFFDHGANPVGLSTNASGACRFEAKGTTGSVGNLTAALEAGKLQTSGIGANDPISRRVAVGCALGGDLTKVILLDPEPDANAESTNLTADMVRRAARAMRQPTVGVVSERPAGERAVLEPPLQPPAQIETIFRGPTCGTGPTRELKLKREEYRADKRHGWLEIE